MKRFWALAQSLCLPKHRWLLKLFIWNTALASLLLSPCHSIARNRAEPASPLHYVIVVWQWGKGLCHFPCVSPAATVHEQKQGTGGQWAIVCLKIGTQPGVFKAFSSRGRHCPLTSSRELFPEVLLTVTGPMPAETISMHQRAEGCGLPWGISQLWACCGTYRDSGSSWWPSTMNRSHQTGLQDSSMAKTSLPSRRSCPTTALVLVASRLHQPSRPQYRWLGRPLQTSWQHPAPPTFTLTLRPPQTRF